jgi:hypothetical protein
VTNLLDPSAYLCHYTRAQTAFASIVPAGKLMMNPYSKMRDPFENKRPMFRSAGAWGDDSDAQMRLFWLLQAAVSVTKDPLRLLSLTEGDERIGHELEKPFRCPWARARMWEQYADNHAGACLVFDRETMLQTIKHDLGAKGRYWHGPVEYTVAGFAQADGGAVNLGDFQEWSLKDDVAHHVVKHYRDFFFLKTTDWATEFEYRFVFEEAVGRPGEPVEPAPAHFVSFGSALRYVIVGEKFPEWQLPAAAEVARQAGVELRLMQWDETGRPYPGRYEPRGKGDA